MSFPRTLAAVFIVSATLGAAGLPDPPADRPTAIPTRPDAATSVHVLSRLGYGPRPGDIERIQSIGFATYIDEQLNPERIKDDEIARRLAGFETQTLSTRELAERYFIPALMERRERQRSRASQGESGQASQPTEMSPEMRREEPSAAMQEERTVLAELGQQRLLRAIYSERQLNEVLVDFWFNHFNVFAGKGADRLYLTEYERDVIRPHVLGKFRDLLGAVAESPAMLFYLDNWMSADPNMAERADRRPGRQGPRRGRTPGPGGRKPGTGSQALADLNVQRRRPTGLNENYARELLELHTLGVDGGYTQKDVVEVARALTGWTITTPRQGGGFRFDPRLHDAGEKTVLGHRIAAGGGKNDGERVLDIVAAHPSTARFIATKLARRFVADEPPAALVGRAAARFRETGGDLRETVRVIVTSSEFFAPDARRAKVKTPLEFVASAARATGASVANALPLLRSLRDLGMPLYMCQPPTGYDDTAEAWVNTGALLNRMNFAVALATGTLRGVRIDPALISGPGDAAARRAAVTRALLGGDASETTSATLAKTDDTSKLIALTLGSPEFQRR
jgi:uncharacterized protein (DUF1800 family)